VAGCCVIGVVVGGAGCVVIRATGQSSAHARERGNAQARERDCDSASAAAVALQYGQSNMSESERGSTSVVAWG